ncbi:MAG: DUF3795 domain-containing protein [Candidatus Korarchaeota archaeon]|nr:DUF3795 domain-containing protein [Candidatus Korarchaeota archaeon]NIU82303.1 DUF3795 domain-containing protein [Candidatus Thorarchaeota archaeon]NIW12791.1 DUF3795 domain-containing protein [Candidatus Thorarchaeota archaeon]NIW50997.1 DUF3795 domain-containing protein [Candidatus Korarchaeota archaeon]
MSKELHIAAPCGLICDPCPYYTGEKETKCKGCVEAKSNLFWGECTIAKCANETNVKHCGLCAEFPCETLITQHDPNNPKGKQEAIFRIGQLAIRSKIGTEEWLKKRANGTLVSFRE